MTNSEAADVSHPKARPSSSSACGLSRSWASPDYTGVGAKRRDVKVRQRRVGRDVRGVDSFVSLRMLPSMNAAQAAERHRGHTQDERRTIEKRHGDQEDRPAD